MMIDGILRSLCQACCIIPIAPYSNLRPLLSRSLSSSGPLLRHLCAARWMKLVPVGLTILLFSLTSRRLCLHLPRTMLTVLPYTYGLLFVSNVIISILLPLHVLMASAFSTESAFMVLGQQPHDCV
jgi:hypothetical protein